MGIRTPDLYVANVSRYQLCYSPNIKLVVGTNGLEPSTSCMSSKRSNQLSYTFIKIEYHRCRIKCNLFCRFTLNF